MVKLFVREALNEALKLETALGRLRSVRRVALLHHSPIAGTVEERAAGDLPFLGSSRLEEPLIRYPVDVVFHGHAHHGSLEGRTMGNVPVYNVSMSLLHRTYDGAQPFRVVELKTDGPVDNRADGQAAGDGQVERRSEHPDRRAAMRMPEPDSQ
jgi:hypothetical protein